MGRGILRGAGGDENLKFNFIWPKLHNITYALHVQETNFSICNVKNSLSFPMFWYNLYLINLYKLISIF